MISIRDGKMRITEGARTVFDSDDKLLHILGEVNGVSPLFRYSAGDNVGLDINDKIAIGTVPAVATQVVGAVKFVLGNYAAGMAFDRWHMVMGGTVVWLMDGEPGFADRLGSNLGLRQFCSYHFSVTNGVVYLNRRVVIDSIPALYFIREHRITYRLRAGVWV